METSYAILIHNTNTHFLPTNLPAQFYGMPYGKVMIIYARFNGRKNQKQNLEYVFAEHAEFEYDYYRRKLFALGNAFQRPINNELVDKPNPVFVIKDVETDLKSFSQAYNKLNEKAKAYIDNRSLETVAV